MERSIRHREFQGENGMAVTVKQIADELNISFQLVSAVLNNKNYCRASEEKKRLIRETAAKMGYMPNVNARVLAGKPSGVSQPQQTVQRRMYQAGESAGPACLWGHSRLPAGDFCLSH